MSAFICIKHRSPICVDCKDVRTWITEKEARPAQSRGFFISTYVNDRAIEYREPIGDPFVYKYVVVGIKDLLKSLFRGKLTVRFAIDADGLTTFEVINTIRKVRAVPVNTPDTSPSYLLIDESIKESLKEAEESFKESPVVRKYMEDHAHNFTTPIPAWRPSWTQPPVPRPEDQDPAADQPQ